MKQVDILIYLHIFAVLKPISVMKKALLFILFLLPLFLFAQKQDSTTSLLPVDSITKEVSFSEVVHLDSTDANTLYSRAKLFNTISTPNDVYAIQSTDDISKIVLFNSKTPVLSAKLMKMGFSSTLSYIVKVECKDGRYRYTETNFKYHIVDPSSGYDIQLKPTDDKPEFLSASDWKFIQMQTKIVFMTASDRLKKHMSYNSDF